MSVLLEGKREHPLLTPFDLDICTSHELLNARAVLVQWVPDGAPSDGARVVVRGGAELLRELAKYDNVLDAVVWRLGWSDTELVAWSDGATVVGVKPVRLAEWRRAAVESWRGMRQ